MMRIQVDRSALECTLRVEGEIEGVAASELEDFWRNLVCSCSGLAVIVDFRDVIHVDRKARGLLRTMYASGVKFTGARLAIQDLLDEIAAGESRHP